MNPHTTFPLAGNRFTTFIQHPPHIYHIPFIILQ
jgi:hypothetical protein